MKNIIVIIPFIITFILTTLVTIQIIIKNKEKSSRCIKVMFALASLAVFSYTYTFIAKSFLVGKIFESVLFISIDWILFFLLKFIINYVYNEEYTYIKMGNTIIVGILMVDSVIIALNPFTNMSVKFNIFKENGLYYYIIKPCFHFYIHLTLCYIIIALIFGIIIKKMCRTPWIYRKKYTSIFVGFLLIIFLNAVFLISDGKVDYSILTYPILAWIIYYFQYSYVPDRFLTRTKSLLIEHFDDAIVAFDFENKLTYHNLISEKLLNNNGEMIENLKKFLNVHRVCEYDKLEDKMKLEYKINKDHNARYFNVEFSKMYDERKRYIGCFFVFHEKTEKIYLEKYDHLTGIYNRRNFCIAVMNMLNNNPDVKFSIIDFDIFQFKIVNEIYGNDIGDKLLCIIGDSFATLNMDKIVYGRIASDNFVLCMPSSEVNIEKLDKCIKKSIKKSLIKREISLYYGIYNINDGNEAIEHMCEKANLARRNIKGNSFVNYAYFSSSMIDELLMNQELITDMNQALESGQFEVFYQPQYDYSIKKIIGAEALVRWNHPKDGYISPGKFIPLFEKNGFVAKLDEYVWECVCKQIRKMYDIYGEDTRYVSVNISRIDMYYMDICDKFLNLVNKYNIPKKLLKLEVTESAYVSDKEALLQTIDKLRNQGFTVEMDDFGSGYSSLNALKDMPVDVIKLDMEFIKGFSKNTKACEILKNIIQMINNLNLTVIAEGIQTKEEAEFLYKLGCNIFQGYYFSKPVPDIVYDSIIRTN